MHVRIASVAGNSVHCRRLAQRVGRAWNQRPTFLNRVRSMHKARSGTAGRGNDRIVRVSKEMSKILRHHPPEGAMDSQGWVDVPVLLSVLRSKPTYEELLAVVEQNDKSRFVLDEESVPPRIRAAQGHSVHLEDPVLTPVSSGDMVPYAVHVTSDQGWQDIQASGELRRMSRMHIHFAMIPGHVRKNRWATVFLELQLAEAMAAGHQFYTSSNGVVLTQGPLPVQYVRQVAPADMPPDWEEVLGERGKAAAPSRAAAAAAAGTPPVAAAAAAGAAGAAAGVAAAGSAGAGGAAVQ